MDGLLVDFDGLIQLTLLIERDSQVVTGGGQLGSALNRIAVGLDRLIKIALPI